MLVELDGSFGEGGGQIIRSALTLSILTGRAFRIVNIRANRPKPGLQPQHLTCVTAAAAIAQARTRGATVGSRELTFEPGAVQVGEYTFDIGTAGAVSLVLHTVFLPLALRAAGPSTVTITGGTHVPHAPTVHFLSLTWANYMRILGLRVDIECERPGFYPRGGGKIAARIEPVGPVQALQLIESPALRTARILSAVANLPFSIAERQAQRLSQRLEQAGLHTAVDIEQWSALSPGTLAAVIFPQTVVPTVFTALGARGKPAEAVADEAAEEALAFRDAAAPVDAHSADQLLIPLALCDTISRFRTAGITRHLTTNAAIVERFLPVSVSIDGNEEEPGTVTVEPVI